MNIKKDIILILILILTLSSIILLRPLGNLDEIWNYSFAKNISGGLTPYKDFNIIITPLFPLIGAIIVKFFGQQLIIMRILAIINSCIIIFLIYRILKKLHIPEALNYLLISLFFLLVKDELYFDYNWLVLLFALLVLLIELIRMEKNDILYMKNRKKEILLGALAGCIVLTKQSVGAVFVFVFVMYKWMLIRNKKDFKQVFIISLYRGIGVLIPIVALIIYLFVSSSFLEFWDYCVLGIKTFSNSKAYIELIKGDSFIFKVLAIIMPLTILCDIILMFLKKFKDKNLLLLFAYSISTLIIMYPIADNNHFLIGSTICLINFAYIIYNELSKRAINLFDKLIKFKKIKDAVEILFQAIVFTLIILIIIAAIKNIVKYAKQLNNVNYINNFKYIETPQGLYDYIIKMDEYIQKQEKEVYILDFKSLIFMIPIDRYTKNFDLFMKGNFGGKGEDGVIEQINSKKAIYLIETKNFNWQTPMKVIEYVKTNFEKTGEIGNFAIYEN